MKKSFTVDSTYNDIRLDKWLRNNIGQIPQQEKNPHLRTCFLKTNITELKVDEKKQENVLFHHVSELTY